MLIHTLGIDDALKSLVTSADGLTDAEATRRLAEYGPNEIAEARRRPLYKRVAAQFTHFLALLLWTAALLCLLSEYMHPGEGMASLGLAITAVIIINAVFTLIQEYRAERAVEALKKLLPSKARILRDGMVREARSEDAVPGDVILLGEGDKVPADVRVISSTRLMVNNAPLTGESDARPRSAGPSGGDYLDSPNIAFAGTLVVGGSGRAVVFATGMTTEFGKVAHLTATVEPGLTPLQKEIIKATRIVAVIAVTTGVLFFGVGLLTGRSFWHNFLFAIGIIIANVPEGLLPTVTLALAMGSQRMARKHALMKDLASVETLGSVTVICTDKTGTLTQNKMEVRETWTPAGPDGRPDGRTDSGTLMKAAILCNNAVYEGGRYRGDPTEAAILKAARKSCGDVPAIRLTEIPFDSERKMMTTVCEAGGKTSVFTKGALEAVMPRCSFILAGGEAGPLGSEAKKALEETYFRMTDDGLRVLAFACKEDVAGGPFETAEQAGAIESGLTFVGLMGLEDPLRPEVPEAVRKCVGAGIRVVMLTGDASRTALAVARRVGLAGEGASAVEGRELDAMSDSALRDVLLKEGVVFSRMTPLHKMRIVSVLKDEGERVAVTGDGVNDAPALRKADIGIAMGLSGTDVAREAADMVLLDDNFATIVNAVEEGRAIFENLRKFITYIFAHLTPEAVPYIMFALFRIPLPLTVMQILAVDLGTETVPALALGVEPPETDVMKNAPTISKRLIDGHLLLRSYVFLGLIGAAGATFGYFYVLYSGGWRWGTAMADGHPLARAASSATFLGIVIMQVANVFACRSSKESVFRMGFLTNRLAVLGIAVEVALSAFIIYHPLGNRLFGTAPLGLDVWLVLTALAACLLTAEEIRKYFVRRAASQSSLLG